MAVLKDFFILGIKKMKKHHGYGLCREVYGPKKHPVAEVTAPPAYGNSGGGCATGKCSFYPESGMAAAPQAHRTKEYYYPSQSCPVQPVPSTFEDWNQYLKTQPLTLVYVWKEDCLPCSYVKDQIENLSNEYTPRGVTFWKDQIDNVSIESFGDLRGTKLPPTLVHWDMANVVPFFVLYRYNQILHTISGYQENELRQALDIALEDFAS